MTEYVVKHAGAPSRFHTHTFIAITNLRHKKYSFLRRSKDTWNGLKEEVIEAKNVQLKEELDQYRYEHMSTQI